MRQASQMRNTIAAVPNTSAPSASVASVTFMMTRLAKAEIKDVRSDGVLSDVTRGACLCCE